MGFTSVGFDDRFVNQHDGNVILDRIDAQAFAAFQSGPILFQDDGLLAQGAYKHVKQILRNHGDHIVARIALLAGQMQPPFWLFPTTNPVNKAMR